MAIKEIAHKPELTKEQAEEIFRKNFEPKYKVEEFKGYFRDFMVVKNAWVGVAVKLEQDEADKKTKIVYSGLAPRVLGSHAPGLTDRRLPLERPHERDRGVHRLRARVQVRPSAAPFQSAAKARLGFRAPDNERKSER